MTNPTDIIVIEVSVGVAIGILVAFCAYIAIRFYRKRSYVRQQPNELSAASLPIRANGVGTSIDSSASLSVSDGLHQMGNRNTFRGQRGHQNKDLFASMSGIPRYSYKDIQKATQNFTTILGQGSFGPVYKAVMPTSEVVAVKVLAVNSRQGEREFQTEVVLLSRLHHRNLVNLVGYCVDKSQRMLVYEFMSNGSLANLLYGDGPHILSWEERLQIALDVSHGIEYLHEGAVPPVIHRDLKSANILLDKSMRAKVADFGLSKEEVFDGRKSGLKGTYGYMDPDYMSTYTFTKKSDIYSFGIILFELITAINPQQGLMEYINLAAIDSEGKPDWDEILDSKLVGKSNPVEVRLLADIAYRCLHKIPRKRPSVADVTQAIAKIRHRHLTREDTVASVTDVSGILKRIELQQVELTTMTSRTKLSESVKNIEKNFDSALGLEEKPEAGAEASGAWGSTSERKGLFDLGAFMGHIGDGSAPEASVKGEPSGKEDSAPSSEHPSSAEEHDRISSTSVAETPSPVKKVKEDSERKGEDVDPHKVDLSSNAPGELDDDRADAKSDHSQAEANLSTARSIDVADFVLTLQQKADAEVGTINELWAGDSKLTSSDGAEQIENIVPSTSNELHHVNDSQGSHDKHETEADKGSPDQADVLDNGQVSLDTESSGVLPVGTPKHENANEQTDDHIPNSISSEQDLAVPNDSVSHDTDASNESVQMGLQGKDLEPDEKKQSSSTTLNLPDTTDPFVEVEKVKKEMKMMEAALQGAARQAQAKADEIAKLMNENELLKSTIEDLKRKSTESEIDALREEYHQRVAALERKVYALSRERDTLRREQSKKSDAAALLKEKDEIISQVMAEGEELSKKQAAQEATIRKLRAQIREFEEEKQRLNSKLQVEESKVESIKRDKAATEKLLQETIERNQAELAVQKEFYTNALNAAKEAEALAEARANSEARTELENRLREGSEREAMLVLTLEELRQTLSRTEQQAAFREEMLRRDIDDLQKRYQASELRYNELITQVPESTRPLLRQIEAMQETTSRRAEAWAGVERALNSRLQEAEAKAVAAEERERALNERLSQSLSRITVLETQITCLRTEQTQLSRSLEKERQRASESRQEYLAAMEEAATQEGRAKQLEDEIRELRSKHKKELQEEVRHRELLEMELEKERIARSELEKTACEIPVVVNQDPRRAPNHKLSSARSLSSMEESHLLQASLDSSDNFWSERRISGETSMSPYFLKSMTPSAFEAALRQKDGELSSYMSRLASFESIRDSLAEELVKMTEQCEKLRAEAAVLPGLRAELEALRRRHSSALELMGERDEELEELRADIVDLKEMYREQVNLLVNRIQRISSSAGAA